MQNKEKIEQEGQGKFIPAGLTKVVGTETMQQIIRANNQFLQNMVSIPINGISPVALKAEIVQDNTKPEKDQTKTTAYDYITSAEWCQGLEPTDREGRYLLLTTQQEVKEAREWLDDNLEELFTEYIPQYQTFTPIEGYDYPKRGDKPRFSHQFGSYAEHLRAIYTPSTTTTETEITDTKWNKSPIHKNRPQPVRTFNFDSEQEYPELPAKKAKRTQSGDQKQQDNTINKVEVTAPQNTTNAKLLREQIMAEMKIDMTKIIQQEVESIRTDFTTQLKTLSEDVNSQIAEVIQTMQALNQRFNEVMERLPILPPTPAHKKSKGLGVEK